MSCSTSASPGSISLDLPRTTAPSNPSKQGVPSSSRKASTPRPAKRNSLPGSGVYSDLIGRASAGDLLPQPVAGASTMLANYNNSSKQRTHFYEEQFQYRDNVNGSVRERISRESPVIAELRTNVIIKDEFTLVTDLSYHLAVRYTRPDSAIMIKVDHSACLALGGTFDPCYILAITTVSSQMGPTMNKRNAALIQSFLADILSVPPDRGILKFCPVPEENFATNGTTMLGEIERQEKQQSNDSGGAVRRAMANGRKSMPSFKKSMQRLNVDIAATEGEDPHGTQTKTADILTPEPKSARSPVLTDVVVNGDSDRTRSPTSPPLPSPATIPSTNDVFELPAGDWEKDKPSASQSKTTSSNSDGLRMNGISDATINSGAHNPTTPSAKSQKSPVGSAKVKDRVSSKDTPTSAHLAPLRKSSMPHSTGKRSPPYASQDPSRLTSQSSPKPATPRKNSPRGPPEDTRQRPRDVYIDGVMGTPTVPKQPPHKLLEPEKPAVIVENLDPQFPDKKNEIEALGERCESAANTAKRRSTVVTTTTSKPPPTPDKSDAKSAKSMKTGKRKSFLSAFRRSSAVSSN